MMGQLKISLMTYIHVIISFPVFSAASRHSNLQFVTSQIYQPSTVKVKDIKSQSKIQCLAICIAGDSCSYAIYNTTVRKCRIVENAECNKWREEDEIENVAVMIKADACAPGWLYYNGRCYVISTDWRQFAEAEAGCNTLGGHVVSVPCKALNLWLKEAYSLMTQTMWIGANCRQTYDDWRWIADNKHLTFKNWHLGEPNGFPDSRCASTELRDGRWGWDDMKCWASFRYICEK